jgi:hypothetical protein
LALAASSSAIASSSMLVPYCKWIIVSDLAACMTRESSAGVRSSSQSISSSAQVRVFGFPPVRADPVGAFEVRQHEDVEQLSAWSRAEGIEALSEFALDVLEVHVDRTLAPGGAEDRLGATERGSVDRRHRLSDG